MCEYCVEQHKSNKCDTDFNQDSIKCVLCENNTRRDHLNVQNAKKDKQVTKSSSKMRRRRSCTQSK